MNLFIIFSITYAKLYFVVSFMESSCYFDILLLYSIYKIVLFFSLLMVSIEHVMLCMYSHIFYLLFLCF